MDPKVMFALTMIFVLIYGEYCASKGDQMWTVRIMSLVIAANLFKIATVIAP